MIIGIVPSPRTADDWQQIEAYLEPAAKLGGVPILEQHEEVWTVESGGELLAAATGRLALEHEAGEIVLCGGRDAQKWAVPLSERMCDWFRMEGMKRARIYGRKGWLRLLAPVGWQIIGKNGKVVAFEKAL